MINGLFLNMNNVQSAKAPTSIAFNTNPVFNPFVLPFLDFGSLDPSMSQFQQTMKMFDMLMNNQLPSGTGSELFNMDFNTNIMPKFYSSAISNASSKLNTNFKTKTNLTSLNSIYNPELSNKLANIACNNAMNPKSEDPMCYRGVKETLNKAGMDNGTLVGRSAFMASNQLSNHKNFKEVAIAKNDLKDLPAGCVIVWEASKGQEHGHIAVTLGDGKEASDKLRNLVVRDAEYSVFVPTGINKLS